MPATPRAATPSPYTRRATIHEAFKAKARAAPYFIMLCK
jgi:hypothetical protein